MYGSFLSLRNNLNTKPVSVNVVDDKSYTNTKSVAFINSIKVGIQRQ